MCNQESKRMLFIERMKSDVPGQITCATESRESLVKQVSMQEKSKADGPGQITCVMESSQRCNDYSRAETASTQSLSWRSSFFNKSSSSASRKRSVHFSWTSQVNLFRKPSRNELEERWYTRKEKDELKCEFAISVGRMSLKRSITPIEQFEEDQLYECIGMESRMSLEALEKSQKGKRDHVRIILAAQARQAALNIADSGELARLSEKKSWHNCELARKRASYWQEK